MTQVDAILCSDLHLRLSTPACRRDNYVEAQTRKLLWLKALQRRYDCPVLCAGDVFDSALAPPEQGLRLIEYAMRNLPDQFFTIAGQHDIAYHKIENLGWSPLGLLQHTETLLLLTPMDQIHGNTVAGFHYGSRVNLDNPVDVLIMHTLVWDQEKPYPGAPDIGNANTVLRQYPNAKLILTGDNHKPCVVRRKDRLLVNPGSMMRMDVTQADFHPRVYLWNACENDIQEEFFPIDPKAVDTASHTKAKEAEERMDKFTAALGTPTGGLSLDFRHNVESQLETVKEPRVREIVTECIDKGAGA